MDILNNSILFTQSNSSQINLSDQLAKIIHSIILPYILSFLVPPTLIIGLIHNVLIMLVFCKSLKVGKNLSISVRLYYILMAFSDLNFIVNTHLTYFYGKISYKIF